VKEDERTPEISLANQFRLFLANKSDYSHRSHAELVKDVNALADLLREYIRENDRLMAAVLEAKEQVRMARLKNWVLGGATAGLTGLCGFLALQLFARLH